ncbi:MAG TPA: adenosine kinase [Hyphomicrobiaceae bacterium]|nr:adenosine kinase [Hyphomicrobiaceae bacterium]
MSDSETRYDVVGIGNAIVDVIGRCDHAFLAHHGLDKGHMRLVDAEAAARLYAAMGPAVEISGGSVANTIVGIASLGGRAAFIGKVADDEFGRIFAHDIRAAGVIFKTPFARGGAPTARSLILVTPDGERTMSTYLGVSPELDDTVLDPELIRAGHVLYLEGYLFDRPEAKAAFYRAAEIAAAAGRRVALSLSDGFCVDRHRTEFLALIRERIDILFANESEVTSLYRTSTFEEAARRACSDVRVAVLTRSAKGSTVISGEQAVTVPADRVGPVVDTTGAGDLYAAGFLYGLTTGRSLETCARLGSLAAAEIISHLGARPETSLAALAEERGLL